MARPTTIRDEDILDAARAALLEHGWSVTTAEVASRAGVSEGTLFNRFKTKDELLRAAMLVNSPPVWIAELGGRVGVGDLPTQLVEVAQGGIAFYRVLIPFVMLQWSKGPEDARKHVPERGGPIAGLKLLAAYFDAEMRLGRIARHDPEVVARTFTGALWNFVSMEIMFDAPSHLPMPESMFVRSLVRLVLEGLAPRPSLHADPPLPSRARRAPQRK